MIIIDPVTFGDAASTRPSPKNVYNKYGILAAVPAGQTALSYDPTDVSKAPFIVVEVATVNGLRSSCSFTDAVWVKRGTCTVLANRASAPDGQTSMDLIGGLGAASGSDLYQTVGSAIWSSGTRIEPSLYIRKISAAGTIVLQNTVGPAYGLWSIDLSKVGSGLERITRTHAAVTIATEFTAVGNASDGLQMYCTAGAPISFYGWDAELTTGTTTTSPLPTMPTFVSRAGPSGGTYYDSTGILQNAAVDSPRLSYDPTNLSGPPRLLVEAGGANLFKSSQNLADTTVWSQVSGLTITSNSGIAPDGSNSMFTLNGRSAVTVYLQQAFPATPGADHGVSIFMAADTSSSSWLRVFDGATSTMLAGAILQWSGGVPSILSTQGSWSKSPTIEAAKGGLYRFKGIVNAAAFNSLALLIYPSTNNLAENAKFWGAHAQLGEVGSYIPNLSSTVTTSRGADVVTYVQSRAADSVDTSISGLVYSNVPVAEAAYNAATIYAKNNIVYDPATYSLYQSLIDANTNKQLNDTTSWTPLNKPVNRWQMFDSYNFTQTTNPEEIIVCVCPKAVAQGIYLGNVDATEVRISVVDLTEGVVYRETQSLVVPDSKSSFYNWCFKRIRRKSYAVSVALPPYANSLVTIAIRKPGGTAKCGVCTIGPLIDVGLSQYGLSREIRDFSTVNFNFDGTSNQVVRNFAKRMDVDVSIDNDAIDSVIEALEGYRQRPVAWIGAKEFGAACVFGRYSSFKNVIPNKRRSQMNLQIEGTV